MFPSISALIDRFRRSATNSPPEPVQQRPFNLSGADLSALSELQSHPSWPIFLKLLDTRIHLFAEGLLTAESESLLRQTGVILGIRLAATSVSEALAKEAERARAAELSGPTGSDPRTVALFGSSAWRSR